MSYYLATRLNSPFDEAPALTREAIGQHKIGIISEIDIAS